MKIKVKDSEECLVTFEHLRTREDASLQIMMNPLTGNWLQSHKVGDKQTDYYSDKGNALRLVNLIVQKNTKLGLRCSVKIRPRTVLPN